MPPAYLSGEARGRSSATGELTVGQAVRQVREADLSERQLRNMLVQLRADDPAAAVTDPEVERVFGDFVRRYGPAGVRVLGWAIVVILTIHFGVQADRRAERAEELVERQTDIAAQQLRHDREQDARERRTGALTEQDEKAIAEAVADALASERAPDARRDDGPKRGSRK